MPREKIAEKTSTSIPLLGAAVVASRRLAAISESMRACTCVRVLRACIAHALLAADLRSAARERNSLPQVGCLEEFPLVRVVVDVVVDILSISRAHVCHVTIGREEIESLDRDATLKARTESPDPLSRWCEGEFRLPSRVSIDRIVESHSLDSRGFPIPSSTLQVLGSYGFRADGSFVHHSSFPESLIPRILHIADYSINLK